MIQDSITLSKRDLYLNYPFNQDVSLRIFSDPYLILGSESLEEYLSYYPSDEFVWELVAEPYDSITLKDYQLTSKDREQIMQTLNLDYDFPGFFKTNGIIYYEKKRPYQLFNLDKLQYVDIVVCILTYSLGVHIEQKTTNSFHWECLCSFLLERKFRKKLFLLLTRTGFLQKTYKNATLGFIKYFESKQKLKETTGINVIYSKVEIFDLLYYVGVNISLARKISEKYTITQDFTEIIFCLKKLKQHF